MTGSVFGSAAVAAGYGGGFVYLGTLGGYLYVLNATNGNVVHQVTLVTPGAPGDFGGSCQFGNGTTSTPAVSVNTVGSNSYDTVYDTGGTSYLFQVNGTTGSIGWKQDTANYSALSAWQSHYLYSSPLVYNGNAYIGLSSNCDGGTGNINYIQGQLLQIPLSGTSHAPSHIFDVTGYSGSRSDVAGGVWASPSFDVANNTVWIDTGNENASWACGSPCYYYNFTRAVVALDASTLTAKAAYPAAPLGSDWDFAAGPLLYTSSGATRVAALNKNGVAYDFSRSLIGLTGHCGISPAAPAPCLKQIFSDSLGNQQSVCGFTATISPPAFDGANLYFASQTNGSQGTGNLTSVNATTGAINWQQHFSPYRSPFAGVTYANGLVVDAVNTGFCGGNSNSIRGYLDVRYATNGSLIRSFSFNQGVVGEPVVSDGRIFVTTGNGSTTSGWVYALGIPLESTSTVKLTKNTCPPCGGTSTALLKTYPTGGMPGTNSNSAEPGYLCTWSVDWTLTQHGCLNGAYTFKMNPSICRPTANTNHTVSVLVTDWAGEQHRMTYTLSISCTNRPPHHPWTFAASLTVAPSNATLGSCSAFFVCVGTTNDPFCHRTVLSPVSPCLIDFTGQAVNGTEPFTYLWNFGDGSSNVGGQDVSYEYSLPGLHVVQLTATDANELWETTTLYVFASQNWQPASG